MRKAGSHLTGCWIPKRMDGTGLVRLQISDEGFDELNVAAFPQPAELQSAQGAGLRIATNKFRRQLGGVPYRVAMPDRASEGGRRLRTISFQLGRNSINETLFVLAKQLRDVDASFAAICNKNGNPFRHVDLQGKG